MRVTTSMSAPTIPAAGSVRIQANTTFLRSPAGREEPLAPPAPTTEPEIVYVVELWLRERVDHERLEVRDELLGLG